MDNLALLEVEWDACAEQLRRGEIELREGNTDLAIQVARQVLVRFEEIGYPDWWGRAQRLEQDALLAQMREGD